MPQNSLYFITSVVLSTGYWIYYESMKNINVASLNEKLVFT